MSPTEYQLAIAGLQRTSDELRSLNSTVGEIRAFGESNRKRITLSWGLIALDVLLSIGTLIGLHIALDASDNAANAQTVAAEVHTFEVGFCQSSNVSRSQTNGLFDYLFNELLFTAPKISHAEWETRLTTPAAQDTVAGIYYRVASTYAARGCQATK